MSFGQAIKTCFRKYFVISGRAPRSEFWWFTLFLMLFGGTFGLIAVGAGLGAFVSGLTTTDNDYTATAGLALGGFLMGLLLFIFYLVMFIPSLTVTVRRFHDVGLSGWWIGGYWIANIAVYTFGFASLGMDGDSGMMAINALAIILNLAGLGFFVVTLLPSQSGANKYGPNPLGGPSDFPTPPPPPGEYKQL